MSLPTRTRSGQPARTLMVGWRPRSRCGDLLTDLLGPGGDAGRGAVQHQLAGAAGAGVLRRGGADAEDGGEQDAARQLPEMAVDLVLEARGAREVPAAHRADVDGPAVGHDDPVPGDQGPLLAVGDLAVVAADQPRTLRDQDGAARGVVVDRLGDLGDHLAGQIGIERGDQGRRNDRAGLDLPGAGRRPQRRGEVVLRPGRGQELRLAALAVGRLHVGRGRDGRRAGQRLGEGCRRGRLGRPAAHRRLGREERPRTARGDRLVARLLHGGIHPGLGGGPRAGACGRCRAGRRQDRGSGGVGRPHGGIAVAGGVAGGEGRRGRGGVRRGLGGALLWARPVGAAEADVEPRRHDRGQRAGAGHQVAAIPSRDRQARRRQHALGRGLGRERLLADRPVGGKVGHRPTPCAPCG